MSAGVLAGKRILLIVGGGIAAYKCLDLVRRLRERGAAVTPVMTRAAAEFVTPLSLSALAGEEVHRDLFDLTKEAEMGHIQLSRVADLVVVAPATADLMAKMAGGQADDLASTLLMATDTPVMIAPAMNVRMWEHPATQRNLATLRGDGIAVVGPNAGDMACGEYGPGRMAEPLEIVAAIEGALADGPLKGRRILVTSGPTHEPIDPVRYIANRSSGAQGTAIANALRDLGADVVFVTGPAEVARPTGVRLIEVESAREMREAVMQALPVDAGVFAAAVADWRVKTASGSKIKKEAGKLPVLEFEENPDILREVSGLENGRPSLVVGFAAETDDVVAHAMAKRARKGCDWIVANDVSPGTGIMGGTENAVVLITAEGAEEWPRADKGEVARRLAERIASALSVVAGKKICPVCGHVFVGRGWDGIDAHWRAMHDDVMPYEKAWPLLKAGTYPGAQ
ncbi:bifunctional phosphopantothenoylcysteine decarboxylase/phosphopantothenate--cysteine ligase CoaBC [Sagittula sp. S175]|uniref:bifunctional phosphopantothenoylcysteine decarboxylase/phosphopantothenate--cysteine ligase CoaBC n=1 Tax=Sagittula sp. S175 TaxID=3415129 RepID=UPI003C7D1A17